jgi:hypothetical protein
MVSQGIIFSITYQSFIVFKGYYLFIFARCQWLMPGILATWEAQIGRISLPGQPRQIVCETLISKITREK